MNELNTKDTIIITKSGLFKYTTSNSEKLDIVVKENINAEIIIDYVGDCNLVKKIDLESNASLKLLNINNTKKLNLDETINQSENSFFNSGYYELNDNDINYKIRVNLNAKNATCNLLTSSITNCNHKALDIECIHHVADTTSDIKNFEISNEDANYEVKASGTIKKGSKHAKSTQSTRVLTTSDHQTSKVTPLLLIDENDVVASHANTLGQMNNDHLYYLMSRGLSKKEATGLLTLSYLLPLKDIISDEDTKNDLEAKIRQKVGL